MTDSSESEHPAGMDVSSLRNSVTQHKLTRADLDSDPVVQFEKWFGEASESGIPDPNAMALSTVDAHQRPDCRTVLLKYFDSNGLVFFTNLSSNKAKQISGNTNVAGLFFWPQWGRQVIVRGSVEKISKTETLKYFATRPHGSQVGAWVSEQSSIISSRALLEAKYEEMKRKFANKKVPLPTFWGGYRISPRSFEFWQGRKNRLHDRFLYTRDDSGNWPVERLAP